MLSPQLVSSLIGVAIAAIIFFLVRRDHLQPKQAFRWFFVALAVALLGFYPSVIDRVGIFLGIAYPPVIPLILGLGAALVKILLMDIERNNMNVTIDRTVQKLAILETEIEQLKKKSSN
ncbi:DUF2304 domain-containing protein [Thalassotalea euphylliae]|uniref:DUF2304 domain-containing protein n=1 Tax=Thalassotalea euphylliae TaxID=1655234 RepID=UPI0015F26E08|nr:DUF2304 domain-containing protein [Thalassotalea euphylliae]